MSSLPMKDKGCFCLPLKKKSISKVVSRSSEPPDGFLLLVGTRLFVVQILKLKSGDKTACEEGEEKGKQAAK